ncbi:MAG: hypothetical protein IIB19_01415, partial [Chloroflexi bacterium]|nr:hypothetical protein [Chloroflexota bacterium]
IPYLTLREGQEIIKKHYGEDCTSEPDLSPQHERWLSEYALKELESDFLFVTHYPVEKRPMYIYEDPDNAGFTKSFDLLFRGIEANTGGQRVHDYDMLVRQMQNKGLDPHKFSFYLSAFKYGMPPHGGAGQDGPLVPRPPDSGTGAKLVNDLRILCAVVPAVLGPLGRIA